jgi:hypothetical protein
MRHGAFALCFFSGQERDVFAVYAAYLLHLEAHGLSHARDNGNILELLTGTAQHSLGARQNAPYSAKLKMKIHLRVAQDGNVLDYRARLHGSLKSRERRSIRFIFGRVYGHSFGFVHWYHDLPPFSLLKHIRAAP